MREAFLLRYTLFDALHLKLFQLKLILMCLLIILVLINHLIEIASLLHYLIRTHYRPESVFIKCRIFTHINVHFLFRLAVEYDAFGFLRLDLFFILRVRA